MNVAKNYIKGFLWGLLLCIALTLLCGCKTKYITVPEVSTRDSLVTHWRTDSVFQHDSVYIKEYVQGDTVYQFRDRTKMVYRDIASHDTVQVAVHDTVTLFYPSMGEDSTPASNYKAAAIILAAIMLLCFAALIIWLLKRKCK